MKKTEFEKLTTSMAAGRWRFVLTHGVIGWGVTTAILFSLAMAILNGAFVLRNVALALALFCLGGIFWGLFMWQYMVWRRKKLMRKQPSQSHVV